jgi:hypothetical protein
MICPLGTSNEAPTRNLLYLQYASCLAVTVIARGFKCQKAEQRVALTGQPSIAALMRRSLS